MTLQQLLYVISLKRTLSFAHTAKEYGVAQSSVSVLLKSLEKELGCKLFERGTRSVKITPVGEEVARLAEEIRSLTNQIRESALMNSEKSLEINVFVDVSFSYIIPDLLQLSKQDIKINATSIEKPDISLLQSSSDFIICADSDTPLPANYAKRDLFREAVQISKQSKGTSSTKRERCCIALFKDNSVSNVIAGKLNQLFD